MKIKVTKLIPYTIETDVKNLTDIQLNYIRDIEKFKAENLRVPTLREICSITNRSSVGTVHEILNKLRKRDYYYDEVIYNNIEVKTQEDLQAEIDYLKEQLEDIKQDMEDNYKRIPLEEQL